MAGPDHPSGPDAPADARRRFGNPGTVELSQREKEILQWTADGKSSDDVSVILGISKRTVNFHINHCLKKLGCQNKIAAAVKASLMGLLWK
jgi:LuxR family transcriptional regulator